MTPVLTRHRSPTAPTRAHAPSIALGLMIALFVLVAIVPRLGTARHVPSLRVDNPTDEPVNVDVSGASRGGWVGVGPIDADEGETVLDVYDPGSVWVFRFQVPGGSTEELRVSRDDLAAADWTVTVPASVAQPAG